MTICKFWLQGFCRNGDSCRFEHPIAANRQSQNRFGPLSNDKSYQGNRALLVTVKLILEDLPPSGQGNQPRQPNNTPYGLDSKAIATDLGDERPVWILSAYGPGKNAPVQLFGGLPRETSFEELRLRHYELASKGLQQQAIQEAEQLYATADEQMKQALRDTGKAIRYIIDGENQHPNRFDIIKQSQEKPPVKQLHAQGAQSIGPSATLGQGGVSFEQASTLGSSFGQPSSGISPFVQHSNTGVNPFSRPSSGPVQNNPFAAPTPEIAANPFAQARSSQQSNPFATANSSSSNPFSKLATSNQQNPFAQGEQFKTSSASSASFAVQAAPTQPSLSGPVLLGDPVTNLTTSLGKSSAQQTNPFSQSTSMSGGIVQGRQMDPSGKLTFWHGMRVQYLKVNDEQTPCYQRQNGEWEKVSFPEPPQWRKSEELPLGLYDEVTEESYKYLNENGRFKDGLLPEMAPKREWVNWDF